MAPKDATPPLLPQNESNPIFVFIIAALVVLGPLFLASQVFSGEEKVVQPDYDFAALRAAEGVGGAGSAPPTPTASRTTQEVSASQKRVVSPPLPANVAPPDVTARAFAIMERSCGALLYGKNEHQQLPPASLAKIVTALAAYRLAPLDAEFEVNVSSSQMAKKGWSVMGIEPGMRLSVRDLLYGLILTSGNDAAVALARYIGGGKEEVFVNAMNAQARALGMEDTHFSNPSGLDDPDLYSSAYDMALAGRAFLQNPELARMAVTYEYQPGWDKPAIKNGNDLLRTYPGAFGLKIGFTTLARETIVAAAERDGRQLIVSVFGAPDRYAEAVKLLDWAFANLKPGCQ